MGYKSLVLFICLVWITGSSCDCRLNLTTGLQCYGKYRNHSALCKEGNTHNPNVTSNATLPTFLNITNTYLGDDGLLNITINDSEATINSSYTYLICVIRTFFDTIKIPTSSCSFEQNATNLDAINKWQAVANVSVFVFTSDDSGTRQGCDYQELMIKNCSDSLNLNVSLEQPEDEFQALQDKPDIINPPIFKVGNITILVDVQHNTSSSSSSSSYSSDEDGCRPANSSSIESASGSTAIGGGGGKGEPSEASKDTPYYHYSFYYPDGHSDHTCLNSSKTEIDHNFTTATNHSIFVEVTHVTETEVRYGHKIVQLFVYEPVSKSHVSMNGKYVQESIPFTVTAKGSLPIDVEWTVNNSTDYCDRSNLTLYDGQESQTFKCTFNATGSYQIKTNFSNIVSNESINSSFTISQPPPINVVATSTSAVAILIVVIIAVVISIVLVGTYISYRKFRNKSTEIADFKFVNLNKPSRWKRLSSQASKFKDKFSNRNKRFGLVNTSESLDSFYGSLNPFAAHETL